jgi:hypothetical protein
MKTHLLQMGSSDQAYTYLIFAIISFIIGVFITRAVFSIPRILRELKAQTLLTAKIAEKQGVSKDAIDKILVDAHGASLLNPGGEATAEAAPPVEG